MAAIGTTGITTSIVALKIGEGSNDVGTLCTSNNINPWSKYKPISRSKITGLTESDYDSTGGGKGGSGGYGIIIPELLSTIGTTFNSANWKYDKPTGGSNSPYRIGDFRNYEHSAPIPFIQAHGTSEIRIGKFVSKNTNFPFNVIPPTSDIYNNCLTILNLVSIADTSKVIHNNYYIGCDLYPRNATSSNQRILSKYTTSPISYSTSDGRQYTGETSEDANKYNLELGSFGSQGGGNYKLHFYLSTNYTTDGTSAVTEIIGNHIIPINWTPVYPNIVNLVISKLEDETYGDFIGIKPSSGYWSNGDDGVKNGTISSVAVGTGGSMIKSYKVVIDVENKLNESIAIPKKYLRLQYKCMIDWIGGTLVKYISAYDSPGDSFLNFAANLTIQIEIIVTDLVPSYAPTEGSVNTTLAPAFKLAYYSPGAPVEVGEPPNDPTYEFFTAKSAFPQTCVLEIVY